MNLTRRSRIPVSFSQWGYVYFALLLLLVPFRLLFAAILSAAVHELFHIFAIYIMQVPIHGIKLDVCGAKIETDSMNEKQELLCALAGPVGGLLLLFLFRRMPVLALTGAIQSLYNLLPLYPTDGGRILRSGIKLLLPGNIFCKVVYITETITLSLIVAFCVYGSIFLRLGILPVLFAAVLLLRSAKGNNSCKP